ncbi:hypothetical protein C4K03_5581 [Pseudomonas synxantha]|uniref:Uncharacterized protein n=1 Tax=Pseudomonas synxantha TaxID=47883 RepID=A0A3G7UGJ3_9PSED|nr:hypothetical protein C4K03_5581 [Pseudomonas synxantha]
MFIGVHRDKRVIKRRAKVGPLLRGPLKSRGWALLQGIAVTALVQAR